MSFVICCPECHKEMKTTSGSLVAQFEANHHNRIRKHTAYVNEKHVL